MPVDPEIRRLAADPEVIFTIRIIDCCFEGIAEARDTDPALSVEVTAEEIMEYCWRMMKRGLLRLMDDGDDDDAPIVQQTVTPAERARARVVGARLFAARQHLRRAARRQQTLASPAARGILQ